MLALKKRSHWWWHLEETIGALWQAAEAAVWKSAEEAGDWTKVVRTFRNGYTEEWWALEVKVGPYGKERAKRALMVAPVPEELPDLATWYMTTNLPAPGSEREVESDLAPASVAEVVRLYGLRMWVEQSYKQVKHALGCSAYQARSNIAISKTLAVGVLGVFVVLVGIWALTQRRAGRTGERSSHRAGGKGEKDALGILAGSAKSGKGVAETVANALAILEGVLRSVPTAGAKSPA